MAKSFSFKQFHINADECGMPVSTDAVLLGAWADINNRESILDIGCGTGILSLMCAQRNKHALITAIEIEQNAVKAAGDNFANSPWSGRLSVKHTALHLFDHTELQYDAIICNPPYFNSGEQAQQPQRAVARHTSTLSFECLLVSCERLLKQLGTASLVLPATEGQVFIRLLNELVLNGKASLKLTRITHVKTTENKMPTRLLIELTKCISNDQFTALEDELIINKEGGYSIEFIVLTKDFYLKM